MGQGTEHKACFQVAHTAYCPVNFDVNLPLPRPVRGRTRKANESRDDKD
jgi:hypothetical protein